MVNPEKGPRGSEQNPEQAPDQNPYEILEKGREEMKNPSIKEMRERARILWGLQKKLEGYCEYYDRMKLDGLSEEELEEIRQERKEIEERLGKVEEERTRIEKDIQEMEDEIKREFTGALKKKIKEEPAESPLDNQAGKE